MFVNWKFIESYQSIFKSDDIWVTSHSILIPAYIKSIAAESKAMFFIPR